MTISILLMLLALAIGPTPTPTQQRHLISKGHCYVNGVLYNPCPSNQPEEPPDPTGPHNNE